MRASLPEPTGAVCDGCWKRGFCDYPSECRCPCDGGRNWKHTDAPNPTPKEPARA